METVESGLQPEQVAKVSHFAQAAVSISSSLIPNDVHRPPLAPTLIRPHPPQWTSSAGVGDAASAASALSRLFMLLSDDVATSCSKVDTAVMTSPVGGFLCPCCACTSKHQRFRLPPNRTPMRVPDLSHLRIPEPIPFLPTSSWEYRLCPPCAAVHSRPTRWRLHAKHPVPGPPLAEKVAIVLPPPPRPVPRPPHRRRDPSPSTRPNTRHSPAPPSAATVGVLQPAPSVVAMEIDCDPLQVPREASPPPPPSPTLPSPPPPPPPVPLAPPLSFLPPPTSSSPPPSPPSSSPPSPLPIASQPPPQSPASPIPSLPSSPPPSTPPHSPRSIEAILALTQQSADAQVGSPGPSSCESEWPSMPSWETLRSLLRLRMETESSCQSHHSSSFDRHHVPLSDTTDVL